MRYRALLLLLLIAMPAIPLRLAVAQSVPTSVVIGVVVRAENGDSLGYSVVSAPALNRERFTDSRGGFTWHDLPAGALRLRVKHIGFTPRDTVIALHGNDTVRVRIALTTVVVHLPAMRVGGACGTKKSKVDNTDVLADLFEQVQQNAERYRLLVRSNPFQLITQYVRGHRSANGRFVLPVAVDTVMQPGGTAYPYAAHHIVRQSGQRKANGQMEYLLTVPDLTDFADTAFGNNHCFSYAGHDTISGIPVLRIDYEPTPDLRKVADVKGTLFVREDSYQLLRNEMELTHVPPEIGQSTMRTMKVITSFTEIVPGVAVINTVESTTSFEGPSPPWGELVAVMSIRWLNGPP